MTMTQRSTNYLLFAVAVVVHLIVIGFVLIVIGFSYLPESTFQLAKESRLPKWIALPSGLDRNDVSIEMSYYIRPWGSIAKFTLRDSKQRVLEKVDGKVKCGHPIQLRNPPSGFAPDYPSYEIIAVKGVTEIIEHRKPEPIVYITDDPAVLKEISGVGCG